MVMRSIFLCGFEVLCLTLTSDVDKYMHHHSSYHEKRINYCQMTKSPALGVVCNTW